MTNNEFMMKCTDCVNLTKIRTMKSTDRYWLQSICYMPTENALILCFINLATSLNSIEKINYSNMNRITIKNGLNYGHVNDITYNPKSNKLYVVPMYAVDSGFDRNLIYVLNASTFAKEDEIHIGKDSSISVYGIAYDSVNEEYYVAMGFEIVKLNNLFEIVSKFSFLQEGVNSYGNVFENLEYYDEKIFLSYSEKIVVFDNKGNYLKNFSTGASIESEGLASRGNGYFILGKSYSNYTGYIINQLFSFNILNCRDINDLLSTDVGVTIKSPAQIKNGFNFVKKIGNIVQCSICITNITAVGTNVVATIPNGYRPTNYIRVIGACSGTNFARFEISKSGDIMITAASISPIQSDYWFELEVTYLTE